MAELRHLRKQISDRLASLDPKFDQRVKEVLNKRTRHLTVVVEDLYQPHNGAAVIRACECFGIQDLQVIAHRNPFQVSNDIVADAQPWVDVFERKESAKTTLTALKDRGYRIAATTLREGCIPIHELPLNEKIAICFGTEEHGLSEEAHQMADYFVRIPMYGFTQSFNISVSTALALSDVTQRLHRSDHSWTLTEEEYQELRLRWLLDKLPGAKEMLKTIRQEESIADTVLPTM